MKAGRLMAAAAAGTIVDAAYGFVVYGNLLTAQFARHPGVFRPPDVQGSYMPVMFSGIFVAMLLASLMYAKGYEGGANAAEGARFGAVMGFFVAGYMSAVNYAILNISAALAMSMAVAGIVEWILVGTVIAVVLRPRAAGRRSIEFA